MTTPDVDEPLNIEVSNLTFRFPDDSLGLNNVNLSLPSQSRTLLVGANGAGKTTLLRLLSGKRLAPPSTISIGGRDPFKDTPPGVTYLGMEWVLNSIVRADIGVRELLKSVGGDAYPDRRDQLVAVLDIDLDWRMHAVSDGERRRVQLAMGLIRPWRILLLDEVTVDLDLLSRRNFLNFLREETNIRSCVIVYATHILDNLEGWPTHLVHMSLGRVKEFGQMKEYEQREAARQAQDAQDGSTGNSRLGSLVLRWLQADLDERGPRNATRPEGRSFAVDGIGGYGLEKRA